MTFCSVAWLIVKKTVADQRLNLVSSGRYHAQYRRGILWSVCCLPESPWRKSFSVSHTRSDTHICTRTLRVNGKEGIKQRQFVLLVAYWWHWWWGSHGCGSTALPQQQDHLPYLHYDKWMHIHTDKDMRCVDHRTQHRYTYMLCGFRREAIKKFEK